MATAPAPQSGTTVILRGSFNPAIFQPAWFARQGLLPEGEAEAAELGLIHPQVATFDTASVHIQVTPDVFEVSSAGKPVPDEVVRDLVSGTFVILQHTPISALGINRFEHVGASSEDAWHHVGNELVPKNFWKEFMLEPGMQGLIIRGRRDDDLDGYIDVRVEPSLVVRFGVYLLVNDHIQISDTGKPDSAEQMVAALDRTWPAAAERARVTFDRLRTLVK